MTPNLSLRNRVIRMVIAAALAAVAASFVSRASDFLALLSVTLVTTAAVGWCPVREKWPRLPY